MKEPIPHGSLAAVLQAHAQAQATLKDRQDFIEKSSAGVMDALGRFEAYSEYNKQKALHDEQLAQQRALHERQIRAHDLQLSQAQKELSTYDKRLAAQLAAQKASTYHTNAAATRVSQENLDHQRLRKLKTLPPPPPTTPAPTPIKTAIQGATTYGSPPS